MLHSITQFEAIFFWTGYSRKQINFQRWKAVLCNDLRTAVIRRKKEKFVFSWANLNHKEVEPPNYPQSVMSGCTWYQLACGTWLSMVHGQARQGCGISQHHWDRGWLPQAGIKQGPGPRAGYGEALGRLGSGSAAGPYIWREVSPCRGGFKTPKLSCCSKLPARKPMPLYELYKSLKQTHPQCLTSTSYKIFQSIK